MWHVSISLRKTGVFIIEPSTLEELAVDLLRGVGGDHEWWKDHGESNGAVAHLHVPTTPEEQKLIPPDLVTMDAGEVGPMRPRTR